MFLFIRRVVIPAVVLARVAEISRRSPCADGLLLTLSIVSMQAFCWLQQEVEFV